MKICAIFSILAVFILAYSNPAFGYLVTVEVEGIVDEVTTYGGMTLDGSVTVGSIMTGSCTYDTETPDQAFGTSSTGLYSLISVSMDIGSYIFTHNPTAAEEPYFYMDIGGGFSYKVRSPAPLFQGLYYLNGQPTNMQDVNWTPCGITLMYLRGENDGTITDALPDVDSFPPLSVFTEEKSFRVSNDGAPSFAISGEITSITVVPEPGTVLLLGLGGLALLRRGFHLR